MFVQLGHGQTFQSVGLAFVDSNGKEFGKATFVDSAANRGSGQLTLPGTAGSYIVTLTLDGRLLYLTVPFEQNGNFVGGTPEVPGVYFESSDCSGTPLFEVDAEDEAEFGELFIGLQVMAAGQPGNTIYVQDPGAGFLDIQQVSASSISAPWGCFPQANPLDISAVTATPLIDLTTVFSFPLRLVADIPTTGGSTSESTEVRFAQFGNGVGLVSETVLTNPSAISTTSGKVEFFDDSGDPLSVGIVDVFGSAQPTTSVDFSIPPLDTVTISSSGEGATAVGSAVVSSDVGVGGIIRFSIAGLGIAGVAESQPLTGFIASVRRQLGGINTGIAIQNTENQPVTLNFALRVKGGGQIATSTRELTRVKGGGQIATSTRELTAAVTPLLSVTPLKDECSGNNDCQDGLFCNGVETCLSGLCQAGTPVACGGFDAGNVCTVGTCDETSNSCVGSAAEAAGIICRASAGSCDPAEACDGISSSCPQDLSSPDDTPTGGTCGVGVCQSAEVCINGALFCAPGDSSPEICDGLDNDCDGLVDEGLIGCGPQGDGLPGRNRL
ncbi:hypothetical protein MYX82_05120 [Acidobacteria bacterium AH-259-D05]|nr:hypothetical protein [Acidobacteria bacterium AH-259-D05]